MSPSYLRVAQLAPMLSMSRATIWRKVAAGTFPKPVKLSERITAWPVDAIQAFVDKAHEEADK